MISLAAITALVKSRKIILPVALILAVLLAFYFFKRANYWKGETQRQEQNITVLRSEVITWEDDYGREHAKRGEIQVKYKELEKFNIELADNWDLTKRELKRTQRLIETERQTEDSITTILKDTIIYRDRDIPIKALTSNYTDGFMALEILIIKDSLTIEYAYRDKVLVRLGWERPKKKFLFWKWRLFSKKSYFAEVVSDNPKTSIIEVQNIEILK
jgi:hypothetical protein